MFEEVPIRYDVLNCKRSNSSVDGTLCNLRERAYGKGNGYYRYGSDTLKFINL